jgi:hypothetical protein
MVAVSLSRTVRRWIVLFYGIVGVSTLPAQDIVLTGGVQIGSPEEFEQPVGGSLTYFFVVENNGPDPITSVQLLADDPQQRYYITSTSVTNGGSGNFGKSDLEGNWSQIGPNQSAEFVFTVVFTNEGQGGITGTVTATGADSNPDNNTATLLYSVVVETPSGSLEGKVWQDLNSSEERDENEPWLAGETVFLDENGDGERNGLELSTVTAADGSYSFVGLEDGSYFVYWQKKDGWRQIFPKADVELDIWEFWEVVISGGETRSGLDFGIREIIPAGLTGQIQRDSDGDGNGDQPLGFVVVYLDKNGNGELDADEESTSSNADGNFAFSGLEPGDYTVRVVIPAGYQPTAPASGQRSTTVAFERTTEGIDFLFRPFGTLTLRYFEDANGNGVRETGEGQVGPISSLASQGELVAAPYRLLISGPGLNVNRTFQPSAEIAFFEVPYGTYVVTVAAENAGFSTLTTPAYEVNLTVGDDKPNAALEVGFRRFAYILANVYYPPRVPFSGPLLYVVEGTYNLTAQPKGEHNRGGLLPVEVDGAPVGEIDAADGSGGLLVPDGEVSIRLEPRPAFDQIFPPVGTIATGHIEFEALLNRVYYVVFYVEIPSPLIEVKEGQFTYVPVEGLTLEATTNPWDPQADPWEGIPVMPLNQTNWYNIYFRHVVDDDSSE